MAPLIAWTSVLAVGIVFAFWIGLSWTITIILAVGSAGGLGALVLVYLLHEEILGKDFRHPGAWFLLGFAICAVITAFWIT